MLQDRDGVRLKLDVIMAQDGQEEVRKGGYELGDDEVVKNRLYGACTALDDGRAREDPGHAILVGWPSEQRKNSGEVFQLRILEASSTTGPVSIVAWLSLGAAFAGDMKTSAGALEVQI